MKNLFLFIVVCLLFGWQNVLGLEMIEVTVELEDGRYRVFGQSRINAPPEFVYATLIDFDNFYKLADGIDETKFLPPDDSGNLVAYTRYDSCVLVFCKTVEKTEYIDPVSSELIKMRAIPNLSDFTFNESSWRIERSDEATLLTYEAEFDPDFWVPPLVGTWAIRRKLVHTAELIGSRIEWMQVHGLTLAQVTD